MGGWLWGIQRVVDSFGPPTHPPTHPPSPLETNEYICSECSDSECVCVCVSLVHCDRPLTVKVVIVVVVDHDDVLSQSWGNCKTKN